jgi:uncharacterized phage-associated protein
MYDLRAIANYFIRRGIDEGIEISPMKLQKLMFFAYGLYYAGKGDQLFSDRFEVWPYGPVIPQLYFTLKGYGSRSIDREIVDVDLQSMELVKPEIDKKDKEINNFLGDFWGKFKKYSAIDLSNATHAEGTPWKLAFNDGKKVIEDAQMLDYFKNLVEK